MHNDYDKIKTELENLKKEHETETGKINNKNIANKILKGSKKITKEEEEIFESANSDFVAARVAKEVANNESIDNAVDKVAKEGLIKPENVEKAKEYFKGLTIDKEEKQQLARREKLSNEQKAINKITNLKEKLESLQKGEIPEGKPKVELTEEQKIQVKELQDKIKAEQKKLGITDKTQLARRESYLNKELIKVQEQINKGEKTPKTKEEKIYDEKLFDKEVKLGQKRAELNKIIEKAELKNKEWVVKAIDFLGMIQKESILSAPDITAKLTGVAGGRAFVQPLYSAVAKGISKVMPEVYAKAGAERGKNMGQYYKDLLNTVNPFANGINIIKNFKNSDIYNIFKYGKTKTELANLGRGTEERTILQNYISVPHELHKILKNPIWQASYEQGYANAIESKKLQFGDKFNKEHELEAKDEATEYANNQIFMGRNLASKGKTAVLMTMEYKADDNIMDKVGKAVGRMLINVAMPVFKVGTNIALEKYRHTPFALADAYFRYISATKKGIENISPKDAQKITELIKKGTVGTAGLMVGTALAATGAIQFKKDKKGKDVLSIAGYDIPNTKFLKGIEEVMMFSNIMMGATAYHIGQLLTEGKNKEAGHVLTVGAKDIATTVPFTSAGYYDVSALKTGGVGNLFGSRASNFVPASGLFSWIKKNDFSFKYPFVQKKEFSAYPKTFGQQIESKLPYTFEWEKEQIKKEEKKAGKEQTPEEKQAQEKMQKILQSPEVQEQIKQAKEKIQSPEVQEAIKKAREEAKKGKPTSKLQKPKKSFKDFYA